LRHAALDRWSSGASALHRRDPRAKTVVLVVFLVAVATAHSALPVLAAAWFLLLLAAILCARLPLVPVLLRAGIVLPFAAVFAAFSWFAGDAGRAVALLLKSYLSALAVLLLVATTPLSLELHGLERMGVPRFLLMVIQFLYRYLFVIFEEARIMRQAAASRGSASFRSAAGALAALFARSYGRADRIHSAMLARGFAGELRTLAPLRFHRGDVVFLLAAGLAPVLLRVALGRRA
jgi:cobalt/nickel transport system permease protein